MGRVSAASAPLKQPSMPYDSTLRILNDQRSEEVAEAEQCATGQVGFSVAELAQPTASFVVGHFSLNPTTPSSHGCL
jgi:hypothetical protein